MSTTLEPEPPTGGLDANLIAAAILLASCGREEIQPVAQADAGGEGDSLPGSASNGAEHAGVDGGSEVPHPQEPELHDPPVG